MSVTDDFPVARGALAGTAAWLAGYLVAYVWKAGEVAEAVEGIGFVSQLFGGEGVPAWKGVGWLFMNAHLVDIRFPTIAGGTRMLNFVTAEDGVSMAFLLIPPVVLLAAGFAVAYAERESAETGPLAGAKAGTTLALGYLPLSVAAGFLTEHAIGSTEAAIAPDPVTAVLLAGLVYPLAFGALGGAASGALD
ncbi:hypothetical protein NGM10_13320 [Halorussus salilacus]|uniref:hypothetical protein n=1 Tax=Halorussus salilacus TaxID=2953750 RepID=UPI0020A0B39E|nr:hypothetical protein [Halorussus salilacus]USZ67702.1 hypothetical protein NGM10_13320 [Halorussus salilacus]